MHHGSRWLTRRTRSWRRAVVPGPSQALLARTAVTVRGAVRSALADSELQAARPTVTQLAQVRARSGTGSSWTMRRLPRPRRAARRAAVYSVCTCGVLLGCTLTVCASCARWLGVRTSSQLRAAEASRARLGVHVRRIAVALAPRRLNQNPLTPRCPGRRHGPLLRGVRRLRVPVPHTLVWRDEVQQLRRVPSLLTTHVSPRCAL